MTIEYKGIRRKTTDILEDYGQAHYVQNVRFKRIGELDRRAGIGKSNMAKLAGPVQFMIGSWNYEPYIINGTGGDVSGNADPLAKWTGATLRIPGGGSGTCVRWGPFNDAGDFVGSSGTFTLPAAGSCVGTLTFTVIDPSGGPYYGMALSGTFIPSGGFSLPCNSVGAQSIAIPAGTTSITWGVSGGCAGGGSSPTWTLVATQP